MAKWSLIAAVLVGAPVFFAACDKKGSREVELKAASTPTPASKQAATPPAMASAEPTTFDAVAERLDRGGSLFVYLSTEQWLSGLSDSIVKWRDLVKAATGDVQDPESVKQMMQAFDLVGSLARRSGVETVTGVGASSFALEPGLYRNKLFFHHHPHKKEGFLWSILGTSTHPLTGLDLLPKDTAVAGFMDFDFAQLLAVIQEEIGRSDIPEAKAGLQQGLLQLSAMLGMTLEELLQSLGGEFGLVITLDPQKTINVPLAEKTEAIPYPRLALVLKVRNERIFQLIDKNVAAMPGLVRVDEEKLKMRTMAVPALPELIVRATVAQWGEYLVLASDDSLVRDLMAAQTSGQGFKSTPEFAGLAKDMPATGNGFQLSTRGFVDTWNKFRGEILKNQPGLPPDQLALMQKLWNDQNIGPTYSVTGHVENGWLAVGKGTTGAGQLVAPLVIVSAAVAAGIAMPVFGRVQEKGTASKSLSNAKQIGTACRLYALDNDGKYPSKLEDLIPDYLADNSVFISPFMPTEAMGYTYNSGLTDTSPPSIELLEDKYAPASGQRVVVRVDTSGEVIRVEK